MRKQDVWIPSDIPNRSRWTKMIFSRSLSRQSPISTKRSEKYWRKRRSSCSRFPRLSCSRIRTLRSILKSWDSSKGEIFGSIRA